MKVLHLSTFDIIGGAARAAYRVHQGLEKIGVDSRMLVRKKSSGDTAVIAPKSNLEQISLRVRASLNGIPLLCYPQVTPGSFSPQWVPDRVYSHVDGIDPDVINLHWVADGYLQLTSITKFNKPMVWTLMDMWAFTGGCHYSQDCDRYTHSCGVCPQLNSTHELDLSRWIWKRKAKAWQNLNLTIVAPSTWMASCARASSLFKDLRIEVIPFCLDTQKYKPIAQQIARDLLNLPQDKQLVLFGAISATLDQRKGFHLVLPALQNLSQAGWRDRIELVVFGASQPKPPVDLGFKTHYLGHLHDDLSLVVAYAAADVMLVPSIQESFGQTASESLACGTPVVAFNTTGLKDIIDHQQNGYLAELLTPEALAQGIAWVLEDTERYKKLRVSAREKAEKAFPLELQARRYSSLYEEILHGSHGQKSLSTLTVDNFTKALQK